MMRLLGNDACASCKQAKKLLDNRGIPYEPVDVATTDYQGPIPVLFLTETDKLEGLGAINTWLKNNVATVSFDVEVK